MEGSGSVGALQDLLDEIVSIFPGIAISVGWDESGTFQIAQLRRPEWNVEFRIWEFGGEIEADLEGCGLMVVGSAPGGGGAILQLMRDFQEHGFTIIQQFGSQFIQVRVGARNGRVVGVSGLRMPFLQVVETSFPPHSPPR